MSEESKRGSALIVIVLSGVTEDEVKQAAAHVRSATCVSASAIGCEAGGMHQFLPHAFGVKDMINTHMTAMRHVAEAVDAHDKGDCDCEAHSGVVPVNAHGGDA